MSGGESGAKSESIGEPIREPMREPVAGAWRGLIGPAVGTLVAGGILVGLGVWQLQRLSWKEGIIAAIEARSTAAPRPLPPPAAWPDLKPADYDYRRVEASGRFDNAHESYIFHSIEGGAGYYVMTPLRLDGGGIVIVNRGFVPESLKDPARRAAGELPGEVRIVGLMRPPEARNLFTPADDPARDFYFTRDPAAIAARLKLDGVAPFTIDADTTPNPGGWPRGGVTQLAVPNNHLSYALTWFGLALGLIGVFVSFAWRRLRDETPSVEVRQ